MPGRSVTPGNFRTTASSVFSTRYCGGCEKRKTTFVVSPTSATVVSTVTSGDSARDATSARFGASQANETPVAGPRTRVRNSASAKARDPSARAGVATLMSFVSTTATGVSVPNTAVCPFTRTSNDLVLSSIETVPLERRDDVRHGDEDLPVGLEDAEGNAPPRRRDERRRPLGPERARHEQGREKSERAPHPAIIGEAGLLRRG